ncbi:MAG: IS66 family insertion sequence element accessory protein TnpA, partial [Planctomycetota bacterium]
MSNVTSSKAAQLWAERIAQCQQSNLSAPKFCQSIGCSLTSFYQWKRKLAASPKQSSFLRVQTSEPTKDSIEIKLPSGISILVPVSAV